MVLPTTKKLQLILDKEKIKYNSEQFYIVFLIKLNELEIYVELYKYSVNKAFICLLIKKKMKNIIKYILALFNRPNLDIIHDKLNGEQISYDYSDYKCKPHRKCIRIRTMMVRKIPINITSIVFFIYYEKPPNSKSVYRVNCLHNDDL